MMALDIDAPALGFDTSDYLSPLLAAVVLLGIGLTFAVTAVSTTLRRDID
jgi:hypothetical protein